MTDYVRSEDGSSSVAYTDRHWIRGDGSDKCLLVFENGTVSFETHTAGPVRGRTSDAVAATAVLATVEDIARLVQDRQYGNDLTVTGDGVIAVCLRRTLGLPLAWVDQQPKSSHIAIDTTGDPDVVAQACAALKPFGLLVLAGFAPPQPFPWDLYRHVHKRGLRVTAAALPLSVPSSLDRVSDEAVAALLAADSPEPVWRGTEPADGRWFRLESDTR